LNPAAIKAFNALPNLNPAAIKAFNALPLLSNMFYVYVIKSKMDGNLYFGSTNDLKKRFAEHNSGKVFSTKHRKPFELVYYEAYKAEKDARNREYNLKLRANAFNQLKRRIYESVKI
ncbi:MAG: GIY-YIG nuclease family protein, partial [bacterium]|nr:GIY-YIG nuclease family protein [bacterium]